RPGDGGDDSGGDDRYGNQAYPSHPVSLFSIFVYRVSGNTTRFGSGSSNPFDVQVISLPLGLGEWSSSNRCYATRSPTQATCGSSTGRAPATTSTCSSGTRASTGSRSSTSTSSSMQRSTGRSRTAPSTSCGFPRKGPRDERDARQDPGRDRQRAGRA